MANQDKNTKPNKDTQDIKTLFEAKFRPEIECVYKYISIWH